MRTSSLAQSFPYLAHLKWQSQEDLVYLSRMKRILQGITVLILAFLMLGSRGCVTTDTVVVPEGPVAAQLSAEKDKQIAGLVAQVKAEQEARLLEQAQASLVAANLEGILFAAEHVPTGLPRNAIEEEAKLGKERSPPANPAELLKAKDRVIAILNGEVEKAKALYGAAFDEAKQAKAQIAAKEREIAERDAKIKAGDEALVKLAKDAETERIAHADDMKKALAAKDAEIKRIKDEAASKERATWILWARILSLGFIAIGALAMIVFKIVPEGAGLVGAGVLIGIITMFVEWLVNQWWFFPLCGIILLGALIAGGFAIYRMWVRHKLDEKKTQAIQDLRDEAAAKGDTKAIDTLDEHLEYRMGKDGSFWQKAQLKTEVDLGLIDTEGEKAVVAIVPEAPKS